MSPQEAAECYRQVLAFIRARPDDYDPTMGTQYLDMIAELDPSPCRMCDRRDKSLKKIKAKLTALTGRNLTNIALGEIVGNVNRSLRGWANYFHYEVNRGK